MAQAASIANICLTPYGAASCSQPKRPKSTSRGQDSIAAYLAHNTIAGLPEESEWHLLVLANCLDDMWRNNPSPMAGTVFSPPDIARLIADILDAVPASLLAPPAD